ncbi:hypothetical protein ANO14919_069510 [Xylariales sp. No.14919]|nr:hypothetical protein ANO14919_069510 [Xylariales sp. No.14919]
MDPNAAFTKQQTPAQFTHRSEIPAVTPQGLRFPFFVIGPIASGGARGDL